MYQLSNLRWINNFAVGIAVAMLLLGTMVQLLLGFAVGSVLVNALLYFGFFAVGAFLLYRWMLASLLTRLKNVTKWPGLAASPAGPPLERYTRQPFPRPQVVVLICWLIVVGLCQWLPGAALTLPLGALAGGWFFGWSLSRWFFIRIAQQLEVTEQCAFYFSDSSLGPRTEMAYYRADAPVSAVSNPIS